MKLLLHYHIGDNIRRVTTRTSEPGGRLLILSLIGVREIVRCYRLDPENLWVLVWYREKPSGLVTYVA